MSLRESRENPLYSTWIALLKQKTAQLRKSNSKRV